MAKRAQTGRDNATAASFRKACMAVEQDFNRRHCYGKIRHAERWKADLHVISLRADGEDVESYLCQVCKNWHVGHVRREAGDESRTDTVPLSHDAG